MGLKETITNAIDNVSDKLSEIGHNANAESEAAKRDVAGDALTPGEKIGSLANEGKERLLAGVDAAKQDARNA
jgi:hypothetical protein